MSTFHEEIAGRIERHLKDRRLVVFYDPRREFEPFVDALASQAQEKIVEVGATPAWLLRFDGSYVALRQEIEARLDGGAPRQGLVYLAGEERDRKRSPLMEADLAGLTYEPQLRKLARDILRDRFSDGQIDGLLQPTGVGYAEIAAFFDGGSEETSILRLIYGNVGSEAILAQWILDPSRDDELEEKGASGELRALVHARVGLGLNELAPLAGARRDLARYVLVNEFRMDLGGASPGALELIPEPSQKDQRDRIRTIAAELRRTNPPAYDGLADEVEADLGLAELPIAPGQLGAVDTFRFEERSLLNEAARLLADGDYDRALELARGREDSHWVRTSPRRLAQWSALQQAAVLGGQVHACQGEIARFRGKPAAHWIERYVTAPEGWSVVDGLDRRLGAFLSSMDEEPAAGAAIRRVRQGYAEWVRALNEGFASALVASEWDAGWELHQTQVFDQVVKPGGDPVAFFVVDAFRYEMGAELAERLEEAGAVRLDAAVGALPTITPVGMAALLPGASVSFSVGPTGRGVSGAIDGTPLPDWSARWRHVQARVPGGVEIRLAELLQISPEALAERVKGASLVLVRSQDIDAVGEAGVGLVAQQAMATVIPNLARAVHRLNRAGIGRFVVSADHGHLLDETQDDDMKIETPGGERVDLHRRCWAGRGGKTPSGAVRVSGANLGYDTDLDFVFPSGRGVFLAGGGLQYHHGGLSLQELIVPVLSIAVERSTGESAARAKVLLHDIPEKLTNRTVGVRVELARDLFTEPLWVRVVLLDQSEQVGEAGMAQGATMDPTTKRVRLVPGEPATVGIMLSREDCKTVRLVVLDADTDAVLAQSRNLNVRLSI